MRESASPSEGVRSMLEMETRLQAFSGQCCVYAPSEGEWKMRESASPSEGVRSMLEMETRLQAFSGRCPICAPSEGETEMRGNDTPSEGGKEYGGGAGGVGGERRKWKVGGESKSFVFLGTFQENVRYYGKIQG